MKRFYLLKAVIAAVILLVGSSKAMAACAINPFNVVGGGTECVGGLGFDIGIDGSQAGVNYQLYRNGSAIGPVVVGTGFALDMGLQTLTGTYTVKAEPGTPCETLMTGSSDINQVTPPASILVTGGGTYCTGGSGFNVGLASSELNVNYRLYKDGLQIGGVTPGTGNPLDFGVQTDAGTYKVLATNNLATCSVFMTDSAVIIFHPAALMHSLLGGGHYCEDGAGVDITLNGSEVGISYQLYISNTPIGSLINGTGLPIDFGNQTLPGQYAAVANPASVCATTMTNSVTVTVDPKPVAFNVTGTASYCAGGTGVSVGLSGSASGISYQLFNGSTVIGTPLTDNGPALDFGLQTAAGSYSVVATNTGTGCKNTMNGEAVVTILPAPIIFAVTGGGDYCSGGLGVHVGLTGSISGVSYDLYLDNAFQNTTIGTGNALDFGFKTLEGTYTVKARNPTTCAADMSGTAVVVKKLLPTAFTLTAGATSYCAGSGGVHLLLNNSTVGVNYQVYTASAPVGLPVAGINAALDLGAQTAAGTYTVIATTTATGCQNVMDGNPSITINPLPVVNSVTGGGSYCATGTGVLIGVGGSETGVTYNLVRGGSTVGTVLSTGGAFNFAPQTIAGTYSVVAVTSFTCTNNMSGTATVSINPLPAAFTVSGTGSYCAGGTGVHVLLNGSTTGIDYQLVNSGGPVGLSVPGTGAQLDFGGQTAAGTYSVVATNPGTGCSKFMNQNATVSISPLPLIYTVTGGGHYCAGGTGFSVGLGTSELGISYQLVNQFGSIGAPVIGGAGTPITFGLQTAAGSYSVIATNTISLCQVNMSGKADIAIDPLPAAFTVSGGGTYCAGGSGFVITLSGSTLGINYQLKLNGSPTGSSVPGTGSALNMGLQTLPGVYTVSATDGTTGCSRNMTGSTTIFVNGAPATFAMTGGGHYCSGDTGVHVGLGGSVLGINYQLFNGSNPVATLAGTNGAIDFGLQTVAGTYTITATDAITSCQANMSGFADVIIDALPLVHTVSGTGSYCMGGTGVDVSMNTSDNGINYQLYRNGSPTGFPFAGVNGFLDFGSQLAGGVYTVKATNGSNGCKSNMAGSATVTVNPLPTLFTLTGGGSYCDGGTGVHVGLSSSTAGVSYKLYNNNVLMNTLAGTGAALDFGLETTAGTYTVQATNNLTLCQSLMSGVATVTVNVLPTVYPVIGGGVRCSNEAGVDVSLDYSDAGISYQLYRGSTPVGVALPGVNGTLSFGLQTTAGTYSVSASNMTTTCAAAMSDTATVSVNPAPSIFAMTGGGHYCNGANGVHVGLSGSETDVNYELFRDGTSIDIRTGTGSAIDFGLETVEGSYSVVATNFNTNCVSNMSGFVTVSIDQLPTVHTLIGAGSSYCAGGPGVGMFLDGSDVGINYQLLNGSVSVGFAVPGNGGILNLGSQTLPGTYIVLATNASTTCSAYMGLTASIVINVLPPVHTITGGGDYCDGTTGVHIGLNGSDTTITYKLYRGNTLVNSFAGTGSAIDFGLFTTVGTYSVMALKAATTCTSNMAGSAIVNKNAIPDTYTVTGGGAYCSGATGAHVGLSSSASGINYQLYAAGAPVGFPVAGTGNALDFGPQTIEGQYTVIGINALTACGVTMPSSVLVNANPLPAVLTLSGGGNYCSGGNGVGITLSSSAAGVNYQLFNGSAPVSTLAGTGNALNFGLQLAQGSYAAVATNTVTGCAINMSGNPVVGIDPLPTVFTVGGGGTFCAGGTGVHVTLGGSQSAVNYQLYFGSTSVGFPVTGTGSSVDFGLQTAVGSYSVAATSAAGCKSNMTGAANINTNPVLVPSVDFTTGMGDSVCSGVTATFTALPTNGGITPAYQWKVNGLPTGISASTLNYIPTNGDVVTLTMTSNATCAAPATVSATRTVSVLPSGLPTVTITADPGSAVCEGTLITFSATPTFGGTDPVYTWIKNGVTVATGTSTYSYVANNGDVIFCLMESNYPCSQQDSVFSNTMTITTDVPVVPSISISADPGLGIAEGTSLTLTANVTNAGATPTYKWFVGNVEISGATFASLTTTNFRDHDSVTCVVTSGTACALSAFNSVIISVFPLGVTPVAHGNSDVMLVPNPNKGAFTVKGTLGNTTDEEVSLEVTNMLGQVVYRNKVTAHNGNIEEHIQLSDVANGMYILNMIAGTDRKVFHVVVEK